MARVILSVPGLSQLQSIIMAIIMSIIHDGGSHHHVAG
jgi:hypothetical protein